MTNFPNQDSQISNSDIKSSRKLFVFRHAQRVDRTFQHLDSHWVEHVFDENGRYTPIDLNMPIVLPKRYGGQLAYKDDTPLTELGYFHAILTGRALKNSGINIHHVYSSPALRCVQTANGIVEGLNNPNLKVNIENGLFEWTKFYDYLAEWMSADEHVSANHYVNLGYKPFYQKNMLKLDETIEEWYNRSYDITTKILNHSQGNVIIVAHRGSPYSCTTQLCGLPIPAIEESDKFVAKVEYLDGIYVEKNQFEENFQYKPLPIHRFSCSPF